MFPKKAATTDADTCGLQNLHRPDVVEEVFG
jgi:hypothetical protein